ncbi:MAG TPA: class I SAM-dependent methyltransferase [Anaerolineales bacterium]|nr:class I SAM-dependent methyltransferase [Anaerolineales bacterium]
MDQRKTHWEHIYETRLPTQVGWYQEHPQLSLQFIQRTGILPTGHIIDVGGGASTLVDNLLTAGFQHITVLDISAAALQLARQRIGPEAGRVSWIEADITQVDLPDQAYDLWHDRAVFHFLMQPEDRTRYIEQVRRAVRSGGHIIVATFAPDGPPKCSGLDVVRYDPEGLQHEFGPDFELVDSTREDHHTPSGVEQKYMYCYCRKY